MNLIIDNEIYEKVVFRALIDHLTLETKPNHHPYAIGWIKKGSSIEVTDLYHIPIPVVYQDYVA